VFVTVFFSEGLLSEGVLEKPALVEQVRVHL